MAAGPFETATPQLKVGANTTLDASGNTAAQTIRPPANLSGVMALDSNNPPLWDSTTVYPPGTIVRSGTDGNYYWCQNSHSGQNPASAVGYGAWRLAALGPNGTRTLTVTPSGSDFATLDTAWEFIRYADPASGAGVTIQFADGSHTMGSPSFSLNADIGRKTTLRSTNFYTTTISAVTSTSGGSGAWTYVVTVASNNGIAIGDVVTINGATGGTNPWLLNGVHEVTNVVGTSVTITNKNRTTAAPSGAVAANLYTPKARLTWTTTVAGLTISGDNVVNLSNINVVNNSNAGNGIQMTAGGRVRTSGVVGLHKWGHGAYVATRGELHLDSGVLGSGNNASNGVYVLADGHAMLNGLVVNGNGNDGLSVAGGFVWGGVVSVANTGWGVLSSGGGSADVVNSFAAHNANGLGAYQGSRIVASGSTSRNQANGFVAQSQAYILVNAVTVTGNTSDYSPALNSVGNSNSIITNG